MPLKVQCQKCSKTYDVKESLAGKEFQCRECGAAVPVPKRNRQLEVDDLEDLEDFEVLEDMEVVPDERPYKIIRSRNTQRSNKKSLSKKALAKREPKSNSPSIFLLAGGGLLVVFLGVAIVAAIVILRGHQNNASGTPGAIPLPPLALIKPVSPGARMGDIDLNSLDADELHANASAFATKQDYPNALLCQHAATAKDNAGQYNLACYYSMVGNVDAAMYWLQSAAPEEGVDSEWAQEDTDLINVRGDSRWPALLAYLEHYNRHWQTSGFSETSLVMPANAIRDRPLPVLIGLHGKGSNAHGFVNAEWHQQFADTNQIAVLGVSGTRPKGKRSFIWSEDPVLDLARIDAALKEVSDRLTAQPGQVILFGFSQGAMMSAEIAARHPDRFAGAIIMSPGGKGDAQLSSVRSSSSHRRQGFVVVCGAGEHPGNVGLTNEYAALLRGLKTRVYSKLYIGQNRHTFPADFNRQLPLWCRFILAPNMAAPN